MAPKSKRNWIDIQMAIMTISMASVLGLWNIFAGPDRETALRKAAEEQASQPEPVESPPTLETISSTAGPLPEPGEKILLGGTAPQTQTIVQTKRNGGSGGGGGGGGGSVTTTSSS